MIKKNPYQRASKKAQPLNSVVVYLDVLGVTDQIRSAYKSTDPTIPIQCLRELRIALSKAIGHLKDTGAKERPGGIRHWEVKAFTDNIVLGYPFSDDGESEMGSTFFHLSLFQFEMIQAGFFVRGAFSMGEHYMDTEIVFGEALLESYDAEQNIARVPRIILTKSAVRYLKDHLKNYGRVNYSPQYRDIFKDVDGQYFLNYLDILVTEDGILNNELKKHRDIVESRLNEFKSNPKIWDKYAWVANYHNYFCDLHRDIDDDFKVNSKLFRLQPSRLSENNR